jgi:cytochrome c oxidase cbb3-type subunit 3
LNIYLPALALMLTVAQSPTAPRRGGNPEAAKVVNPIASTAESVAAGRRSYLRLCSRCHGPAGRGDGSSATGAQPSDLTDAQWDFGGSDGEIFSAIHDGTSADMAAYSDRLSDTEIWNVVIYLRSVTQPKH